MDWPGRFLEGASAATNALSLYGPLCPPGKGHSSARAPPPGLVQAAAEPVPCLDCPFCRSAPFPPLPWQWGLPSKRPEGRGPAAMLPGHLLEMQILKPPEGRHPAVCVSTNPRGESSRTSAGRQLPLSPRHVPPRTPGGHSPRTLATANLEWMVVSGEGRRPTIWGEKLPTVGSPPPQTWGFEPGARDSLPSSPWQE